MRATLGDEVISFYLTDLTYDLEFSHNTLQRLEIHFGIKANVVFNTFILHKQKNVTAKTDGACLPNFEYQHRKFKDWAIALSMPGEQRLENLK